MAGIRPCGCRGQGRPGRQERSLGWTRGAECSSGVAGRGLSWGWGEGLLGWGGVVRESASLHEIEL